MKLQIQRTRVEGTLNNCKREEGPVADEDKRIVNWEGREEEEEEAGTWTKMEIDQCEGASRRVVHAT